MNLIFKKETDLFNCYLFFLLCLGPRVTDCRIQDEYKTLALD